MATIRLYCDCKVNEIGTASCDVYLLPRKHLDALIYGDPIPCRHCGKPLKEVGKPGNLTERQANRIDRRIGA